MGWRLGRALLGRLALWLAGPRPSRPAGGDGSGGRAPVVPDGEPTTAAPAISDEAEGSTARGAGSWRAERPEEEATGAAAWLPRPHGGSGWRAARSGTPAMARRRVGFAGEPAWEDGGVRRRGEGGQRREGGCGGLPGRATAAGDEEAGGGTRDGPPPGGGARSGP